MSNARIRKKREKRARKSNYIIGIDWGCTGEFKLICGRQTRKQRLTKVDDGLPVFRSINGKIMSKGEQSE